MSHVLIVEDEAHLAQGLRFNLEAEGHSVEVAGDGESAIELLLGRKENGHKENAKKENSKRAGGKRERSQRKEFDAVVLDVMLPGKDGFAVASELRAAKNFVPVLMLTARGRPEDVLKGFSSGADDYLPKPFELPILLARLQGLLRRREWMGVSQVPATDAFSFDGRTIDFGKLELRVNRNTIQLTLMEAELLRHLVRNSGRVVSRKAIKAATLTTFLKENVAPGTTVYTDGLKSFTGLREAGFKHVPRNQPLRADLSKGAKSVVPLADRAIGNLQQWLIGTYHGVSRDQLQVYLDEFVFRHNRRRLPMAAFQTLLGSRIRP